MSLGMLCPVFESWPYALCFCRGFVGAEHHQTSHFVLVPAITHSCRLRGRVKQAGREMAGKRAGLMWNQMVFQRCFALRFLGSFKSRKLRRRETIGRWKHTRLTNKEFAQVPPVHSLGRNVPSCLPAGAAVGPGAEEPCREWGHVDSGRFTNPAPQTYGKGNRNSKQNNALQKMFFSKINPKQPPAGSHFSLQMNRFRAE